MKAKVTPIAPDVLQQLKPLDSIPQRILKYISDQASLITLNSDSVIQQHGDTDNAIFYLLKGTVEMVDENGATETFSSREKRARLPLSVTQPYRKTTKANGAVTLLKLPREIVAGIRHLTPAKPNFDNPKQPFDITDTRLRESYLQFRDHVLNGKIDVPSMPDIAMRIARVINDPKTNSDDIARVIQADPTVAARLVSVVNSAAYRGVASINNLQGAVSRLGRSVIHNLVISFALGSLFRSRSSVLQNRMHELWKHSCYVGAICQTLGKVTPGMSADHALLCGLIHDIGGLPIIGAARSHPDVVDNPELLDLALQELTPAVGARVLKKWGFAEAFIQVALNSENWIQDEGGDPGYIDLVIVSQLHAYIGTPRMRALPRLDLVPAFHKLALGQLTPRHSIGILEEAKEQIQEMQTLLSGS